MIDQASAAEALASIDETRVRLAAAADAPPIRHLAFAAIMAVYVASPALPFVWRNATVVLMLVAVVLVIRWDRHRTGMFINGYRAGRTRPVTAALLLCILPLYGLSAWLALHLHRRWEPVVLGLMAGALAYAGSVWWCRIFRREMAGGHA